MKIEKVLSLGYQGALVKEPLSEQLATLRLIAQLSRNGILTRKSPWQIFLLSCKKPLDGGVFKQIRKLKNAGMYPTEENSVYIICEGRTMISLFANLPKDDWTLKEVPAVQFYAFCKKQKINETV